MQQNNRSSRFGLGLLLYVIIFMILSVVFLLFFYDWLSAYEASRPAGQVELYKATVAAKGPTKECLAAFREVDRKLTDESEIRAFAKAQMDSAVYTRSLTDDTDGKMIYSIRSGKKPIGSLTLEQTGEKKFGFQNWELTEESFDFSGFFKNASVTVPTDYQVKCNGVVLDGSYITQSGIELEILSAYYKDFPSLPSLVTYTSGLCLDDPVFVVTDRSGKTVSEKDFNEIAFLDVCSQEEKERLEAFTWEYLYNYVQFTANVHDGFYYYYNQLRQMTAPDSPLNDRMAQAIQSFGFTTTRSCDIIDYNINLVTRLDSLHYLVDCYYTTQTVSPEGSAQDTRNVRLVVGIGNDLLLVSTMTYY